MAKKRRQVALAFAVGVPSLATMVEGITRYAREHGEWTIATAVDTHTPTVKDFAHWKGDGIIAEIGTPEELAMVNKLGIPVVDLATKMKTTVPCRVIGDNAELATMAAEHLMERGYCNCAFYGVQGRWHSEVRREVFRKRVTEAGCWFDSFESPAKFEREAALLDSWLQTLPLPVGIMAVYDYRARLVLQACRNLGLRVPEEVGVIGVDNDTVACNFSEPTLTSISLNGEFWGYQAAMWLDRLMDGHPAPKQPIFISPDGIVQRESTNVVAADDPYVSKVARYIFQNLSEPMSNRDLARLVPISGRWLEQRFKNRLGKTLHDYILDLRLTRAKTLLISDKKMSIEKVAKISGFGEAQQLRRVFHRFLGTTPSRYRKNGLGKEKSLKNQVRMEPQTGNIFPDSDI